MIVGIGSDVVQIDRIEAALARRPGFAQRILTPTEMATFQHEAKPAAYLAKRFAAKEAIAKALGCGIGEKMSWQDVETYRTDLGKPEVSFTGAALKQLNRLGGKSCHLSLSDELSVALAFAVIET
jgi:holo-[acyl-carrier protein] synthase